MDKPRDVRRVAAATRFSLAKRQQIVKQSASGETKKGKLRRLSDVGEVNSRNEGYEMGSFGSDCEDEVRPTMVLSKRFKFSKKFFDEYNTVDHASVPRKLRSASNKRNRKSTSPTFSDSKKMNQKVNGVELLKKHVMKKSKLDMEENDVEDSPSLGNAANITKDEEEVVETLYALAEMFPNTKGDKMDNAELDKPSEAKLLAKPEIENSTPQFEVPKKKQNLETKSSDIARATNSILNIKESSKESLKIQQFNEASQLDLPSNKQRLHEFDSCIPPENLPILSLFSKAEMNFKALSCTSAAFNIRSKSNPCFGSTEPKSEAFPSRGRKMVFASEQVAVAEGDREALHTECNNNGPICPGIPSTGPSDIEIKRTFLQSSSARLPTWLTKTTHSTEPCLLENVKMTKKASQVSVDRKSWKRCLAHVYISRFIEALQTTEGKNRLHAQPTQWVQNDGSKQGGALTERHNLDEERNNLAFLGAVSTSNTLPSTAEKNSDEVTTPMILPKRLLQDQQQTYKKSVLYASKKQGYDFLSLFPGACEAKVNKTQNREENSPDPLTKYHVPYLQSLPQNHTAMPYLFPQHHYPTLPDHLSASAMQQVQIQLPNVGGKVFGLSDLCITTSTQQQQQQHQERSNWTAYLASHYKNAGIAPTNIPKWQNGVHDSPLVQCDQNLLSSSHSPLDALGPKYAPISMQKQQLVAIHSSLPSPMIKRQNHHLPSCYEL